MQFTVAALSAIALAGTSLAQTVVSSPFNLVVSSTDGKYNNSALLSCHSGAGIESLCIYEGNEASTFNLNTTQGQESGVTNDSVPGVLTWYLDAQPTGESESMGFYIEPSTNVAQAMFGLGSPVYVAFDDSDEMNIQSWYDDTVTPPKDDSSAVPLYRWNVCQTNFEGYTYTTLNWVLGSGAAQNPSCTPVSVKRVYTPSS